MEYLWTAVWEGGECGGSRVQWYWLAVVMIAFLCKTKSAILKMAQVWAMSTAYPQANMNDGQEQVEKRADDSRPDDTRRTQCREVSGIRTRESA